MFLSESNTKSVSADTFIASNFEQLKADFPSLLEIHTANKDFLFRQGDHCTYVFWIKSGIVKLSHLTAQGTEITTALLREGDVIGSLHENHTGLIMEETAQTLTEAVYYRLACCDFRALLLQHTVLAWEVLEQIYTRQQKIERKLRTILTQPVEVRLAETLLELAGMFGIQCTHGYALEIYLTQQEVADLIGASRPVVSTILNDLRNRGMLDYTRDQICINDAALLDYYHAK